MKKLLFVCAALVVAGLAVPAAQAQQCLKWIVFCDGIQVNSIPPPPGRPDMEWYHYDCVNNVNMTAAKIGSAIQNACPGGNGNAGILCRDTDACGQAVGGSTWTFVIDQLDGTLDMNNGLPPSCWIDQLQYVHLIGPCSGAPQQGPGLTSSIQ